MFLSPFMLLGLAAVSVPVIIHLLNRRKFDRVVWAAMRFLRASIEKNQRRLKMEDMILLALRCLLIALLVFVLARPVLRSSTAGALGPTRATAVIVLDNSASMSQTDGVESRFQSAKKAAEQIIAGLPAGSSVAVLLASDIVQQLIPEPTYDLTLAASALKKAPLYDRPTDLHGGIRAAVDVLKGRPSLRKEIYIITDGQLSGWRRLNDIRSLLEEHRPDIHARLLMVGRGEERNLGISALRVDGGLAPLGQPVRLEVRVRNYGGSEARDVAVSIAVDNDPPMDQASIGSVPPGEQRSISLFARLKAEGFHTITASLDGDHLPADDTRTVALRAVKDVKVLLIDGDSGAEARQSEVFYLRGALRPVPRAEWDDYYVKPIVKSPTELDATRFEDFDVVVAANVTDFSPGTLSQLVNYVRGGGALWVFPGDNINRTFYNEQLYKVAGLLPAALGEPRGDARSQEQFLSLADRAQEHEIASLWRDPAAGTLSSARFFRVYDLLLQGPSGEPAAQDRSRPTRVVLRFADEKPAMVERDFGQGRVVLMASSADTAWNDLPARAGIFVPLVHRTLGHLVARQDEHLTLRVGEAFRHIAPVELINKDAAISKVARSYNDSTPKGENELFESRRIELLEGTPTLQFGPLPFAGAYEVKAADATPIRFAAQADPDEFNLEMLSDEQQRQLGQVAQVILWKSGASLEETLEQARIGTELWLPLAIAALGVAAVELVLAHWFSKSK